MWLAPLVRNKNKYQAWKEIIMLHEMQPDYLWSNSSNHLTWMNSISENFFRFIFQTTWQRSEKSLRWCTHTLRVAISRQSIDRGQKQKLRKKAQSEQMSRAEAFEYFVAPTVYAYLQFKMSPTIRLMPVFQGSCGREAYSVTSGRMRIKKNYLHYYD